MKRQIINYMKRLCNSNLTTSLGGNISYKISDSEILITPSSIDKANLTEEDIVILDIEANFIQGIHKPSMEYMMHIAVYQKRPDIHAIIHAHPHYSTLFSATKMPINLHFTAEACKNIKNIGIAKYKMMGTKELAEEVSNNVIGNNIVLLQNHGVLTVGKDLLEAFYRMEVLEQAAKMTYHSLTLPLNELPTHEIDYLKSL
ncbi:MAG: class II aldolase/adducin family protein [Lachnospira sp.]|nr:class II aldolase/adducin family protein [Lachnospira sp.]